MGLEACCSPIPTPTPVVEDPVPEGTYSCGGVVADRIGIVFKKTPMSSASCRFDDKTLEAEGDCVILADASVRGPEGSDPLNAKGRAHLGNLPGCWYVVRPRWEQEHAEGWHVDIGVKHARIENPATHIDSELFTEPPYGPGVALPWAPDPPIHGVGSFNRFHYDSPFAGSSQRLRACWPPDKADAVCSPWYTVRHR